jgi:hypothetical protein
MRRVLADIDAVLDVLSDRRRMNPHEAGTSARPTRPGYGDAEEIARLSVALDPEA